MKWQDLIVNGFARVRELLEPVTSHFFSTAFLGIDATLHMAGGNCY